MICLIDDKADAEDYPESKNDIKNRGFLWAFAAAMQKIEGQHRR
jgi:hypothetical protein